MEDIPNGVSGVNVQKLAVEELVVVPEPAPTHRRKTKEKRVLNRIWVPLRKLERATHRTVVSITEHFN